MTFDVMTAMTWILFLGLFPMTFFWIRRAYRIFVKKDHSEVALKKGLPPANPARWAPFSGMINLVAGMFALYAIIGVVVLQMPYQKWSAIAGSTIWMKIFADYILKTQAHPFKFGRKKKTDEQQVVK